MDSESGSQLTSEHHEWIKAFTGVDSAASAAAPGAAPDAGSGAPANAAPGGNGADAPPGDAPPGDANAQRVAEMDAAWQAAVAGGKWADAAKVVNGFSPDDLAKRLAPLSQANRASLYQGALDCGIGPNSAVALATKDAAGPAAAGKETVPEMDARWQAAVAAGDWTTAAEVLNGFNEADIKKRLAPLSAADVAKLHKAAIADPKLGQNSNAALLTAHVERAVLPADQADRAKKLKDKLSPQDQQKLQVVLDAAKTPVEKDYVTKGLAAGHSVAELEAFAKKIASKDAKWMQDNLSLTGNSEGKGVKQQWHMSCNATSVEAVRGEFDPLYALKTHEDNPNLTEADDYDGTKLNPNLAADQKAMLESTYHGTAAGDHAGQALPRKADPLQKGRFNNDLLNQSKDSTGVTYDTQRVDGSKEAVEKAVTDINGSVAKGVPVPIIIGSHAANMNPVQHYVVVTATDPGPPRYYSIHDPWGGKTYTRSEDQLKTGHIDIEGINELGAYEKPTAVPVP